MGFILAFLTNTATALLTIYGIICLPVLPFILVDKSLMDKMSTHVPYFEEEKCVHLATSILYIIHVTLTKWLTRSFLQYYS